MYSKVFQRFFDVVIKEETSNNRLELYTTLWVLSGYLMKDSKMDQIFMPLPEVEFHLIIFFMLYFDTGRSVQGAFLGIH